MKAVVELKMRLILDAEHGDVIPDLARNCIRHCSSIMDEEDEMRAKVIEVLVPSTTALVKQFQSEIEDIILEEL